jgi:hypothetical protein
VIRASGSKVFLVLPVMTRLSLRASIYEAKVFLDHTSINDDTVFGFLSSSIAFARIFAASARVIGASGRNVPSSYPFIHPLFTQKVMYSAYHLLWSTSWNPESVPSNEYLHERARTIIFTYSARVTFLSGSND